jgi:hypothetical protein
MRAVSVGVGAQTTLTLRAGGSRADLASEPPTPGSRTELTVAGAFTFELGEHVGVQVAPGYAHKGAKTNLDFKLSYIEVPLLLKLTLPVEGAAAPHLYLGAAPAYLLACTVADGQGHSSDCGDPFFKSFDLGGVLGVGFDFRRSERLTFNLDAFFTHGLTSIDDRPPENNLKNRVLAVVAGATIPIG